MTAAAAVPALSERQAFIRRLVTVMPALRHRFGTTVPVEAKIHLRETMEQVTASQLDTLMLLWDHPEGLAMHELAAAESSTPSSATQMVDRLIRLGLVERRREDGDRRLVRVGLSAPAMERCRELTTARLSGIEAVTAPLTDAELETLVGLLEKMAG